MASLLRKSSSSQKEEEESGAPNRQRSSKARRKRPPVPPVDEDDDEEQRLTAQLFGTNHSTTITATTTTATSSIITNSDLPNMKKQRPAVPALNEFTFEIDRTGNSDNITDTLLSEQHNDHLNEQKEGVDFPKANATETSTTLNKIKTAAWVDQDDDDDHDGDGNAVDFRQVSDRIRKLRKTKGETHVSRSQYEERLRQRFIQTTQTTSNVAWAQTTTNTHGQDTPVDHPLDPHNISTSTSYLHHVTTTTKQSKKIPPNLISMKRCPDANRSDPHLSVTKVVQFYHHHNNNNNDTSTESSTLLLTAGLDKTLRFFHCAEEESTKIHGVHFPNFPIYSASFIGTSSNVVVTGRRPFFYRYDTVADHVQQIPKIPHRPEKSWERCVASPHDNDTIALLGNDGYIVLYNILQQKPCTTQPIKLNGSVRTVAFNPYHGHELLASGSDGDVYRYDLRNLYQCVERFPNEDGTITSQLATSSSTFAVAAESGVVNLYENGPHNYQRGGMTAIPTLSPALQHRKPIKSIMNIKTCVDNMAYNHDGDLLAISSRFEKDCLKLVHVPTGHVYSNWPTSNTPLGYVFSMDFSPRSNFLAIGNDQGKCLLYKLVHYE